MSDTAPKHEPERPELEWRRSVLAALGGIAACLAIALGCYYLLPRPMTGYLMFSIPFAIFTYGVLIGAIDWMRPYLTAMTPVVALTVTGVVWVAYSLVSSQDWAALGGLYIVFIYTVVAAIASAAGVAWGERVTSSEYSWIGWAIYAIVLFLVVVWPWYSFQRDSARFIARRETDMRAFIEQTALDLPAKDLSWEVEMPEGWRGWMGAEFNTTWETATATAGQGRCWLRFQTRHLKSTMDMNRLFDRLQFTFEPRRAANIDSSNSAWLLLEDLGVIIEPSQIEFTLPDTWEGTMRMHDLPVGIATVRFRVHMSGEVYYDVYRDWDW